MGWGRCRPWHWRWWGRKPGGRRMLRWEQAGGGRGPARPFPAPVFDVTSPEVALSSSPVSVAGTRSTRRPLAGGGGVRGVCSCLRLAPACGAGRAPRVPAAWLSGRWRLSFSDTMDSVKQSAALCLLRLYRASPDLVPMGDWTSRVVHLLNDQHLVRAFAQGPALAPPRDLRRRSRRDSCPTWFPTAPGTCAQLGCGACERPGPGRGQSDLVSGHRVMRRWGSSRRPGHTDEAGQHPWKHAVRQGRPTWRAWPRLAQGRDGASCGPTQTPARRLPDPRGHPRPGGTVLPALWTGRGGRVSTPQGAHRTVTLGGMAKQEQVVDSEALPCLSSVT